jgi:outer membrane protein OmpA-like peptidoglycan-associated protein
MEVNMKKNRIIILLAGTIVLAGMIVSTGCATKKFVESEMNMIDKKVEGIETEVEANQKRLKEHDEQLVSIGALITQQEAQLNAVDGKIDEVKKFARGTLLFQETLRNNDARFKFGAYELSDEIKAALDKFVEMLISQDKGRYLEIRGHTDNTGDEAYNLLLGKKRADAVMDYLYKTHHIPLHRMEVIGLGSSVPVADNKTRDGRAQNRRVEILVYE